MGLNPMSPHLTLRPSPVAVNDNIRHGHVGGVRHLPELRGQRLAGEARVGGGGYGGGQLGPLAHPVVVARLLHGGTEEEAAAGHTRIPGALDVPGGGEGRAGGW